jgi:hypothetical protein
MKYMHPLHDAQELWARMEKAVTARSSPTTSLIRKQSKRSWARKVALPWLKRELEIVAKVHLEYVSNDHRRWIASKPSGSFAIGDQ